MISIGSAKGSQFLSLLAFLPLHTLGQAWIRVNGGQVSRQRSRMTSVEPPAPPIGDPLGAVRVYRLLLPLSVLQAADLYSPPAATARVRAGQLVSGCVPGGNETGRRPCFLELEGGLGWLPLELPGGVEAVKEVHVEEVWPPEVWEVANGGTDLVIRSQPDWQEPSFKGPAEAAGRFVADGAMCLVAAKVRGPGGETFLRLDSHPECAPAGPAGWLFDSREGVACMQRRPSQPEPTLKLFQACLPARPPARHLALFRL